MKFRNSFVASFLALTMGASVLTSAAFATELRLGTIAPPKHVWIEVAERLKEELAKRPEIDLQLTIFPAGQLGQEPETLQQLETGLLDMGIFTVASMVTREEGLNGWYTPYLFPDIATAGNAAALPAAKEMLTSLQDKSIIGLGYTLAGMRHILVRKGVIDSADDVNGIKVRITPFDAAKTWWEALGAVPTPIPAPGIYQALQNGVVDAVEVDLDLAAAFSLYEPAESLTVSGHMVFPGIITMSKFAYDALSSEQQNGLQEAVDIATAYGIEQQIAAETRNMDLVKKHLKVINLENSQEAFAPANQAFDAKFKDIPLVADFQKQAREMQGN